MQRNAMLGRRGTAKRLVIIALSVIALYMLVNQDHIAAHFQKDHMSVGVLTAQELAVRLRGMKKTDDEPEILFNGHAAGYDIRDGKYYATQNMEHAAWDGYFTCSRGQLYWEEDAYFAKRGAALAEGHAFTLYCIDEAAGDYSARQIVFTGMPMLLIDTQSGAPIGDEPQRGAMRLSNMKFVGREWETSGCTVAVRGQSSRRFPKQGYKLVLDQKKSLLGMRRDEDWILAALWDDDGLIHNKLSYDVWRDIASGNSVAEDDGTTMEYVELFCNDNYMGVYGLIERIDAKELSLGQNDILYKCRGFHMPDETLGDDFGLGEDYDIKYPKEYSRESWLPLKEYLEAYAEEGSVDYDRAASCLNMENAIDYNLFILLTRGCDNYTRKNTFFVAEYRPESPGGGTK